MDLTKFHLEAYKIQSQIQQLCAAECILICVSAVCVPLQWLLQNMKQDLAWSIITDYYIYIFQDGFGEAICKMPFNSNIYSTVRKLFLFKKSIP